jgi:hypothetical protein
VASGETTHPLYFFPYDTRPESNLPAPILQHLRTSTPEEVVLIYEWGVLQPGIQVILQNGRVQKVVTLEVTELQLGEDSGRCAGISSSSAGGS